MIKPEIAIPKKYLESRKEHLTLLAPTLRQLNYLKIRAIKLKCVAISSKMLLTLLQKSGDVCCFKV